MRYLLTAAILGAAIFVAMPTAAQVKQALDLTGLKKVVVDRAAGTVYLPKPGMGLDFGGIAKGLALDQAAEVLRMLPELLREQVVERLGEMEPTSTDSIHKIASKLNSRIDRRAMQQGLHRGGGVKTCAEILNALDKELRKTLLTKIEERNATLGAAIRRKVFSFEDIVRISSKDLARVMREVDSADLPIALKSMKPPVVAAIVGTMSKRAAESLKEEIELLSPPRQKDVEAAQDRIIAIVRRLEEAEEIVIDGGAAEPNAGP